MRENTYRPKNLIQERPKTSEWRSVTAGLVPSFCILVLGVLFYNLAHAVIGAGVTIEDESNYPWACKIEIDHNHSDFDENCSGTLVAQNKIVTAAHCFGRHFENSSGTDVRVTCGGRSAQVQTVEVPPSELWVDSESITREVDFAVITLQDPMSGALAVAAAKDLYFDPSGYFRPGVRCWAMGFGNNPRSWSRFGTLSRAEMTDSKIEYYRKMINLSSVDDGALKTSVDKGDSGGTFFCQAPGHEIELVGVNISYGMSKAPDPKPRRWKSQRIFNFFSPIWLHPF